MKSPYLSSVRIAGRIMTSSGTMSSIYNQNLALANQSGHGSGGISSCLKEQWKHSFELFQMLKISIKQMPDIDLGDGISGFSNPTSATFLRTRCYELRKVTGIMGQIFKQVFMHLKCAEPIPETASQGMAASSSHQSKPNAPSLGKRESSSSNSLLSHPIGQTNPIKPPSVKSALLPSTSSSRRMGIAASKEILLSENSSLERRSPTGGEQITGREVAKLEPIPEMEPFYTAPAGNRFEDYPLFPDDHLAGGGIKIESHSSQHDNPFFLAAFEDPLRESLDFAEQDENVANMRLFESDRLLMTPTESLRRIPAGDLESDPLTALASEHPDLLSIPAKLETDVFVEESGSEDDEANQSSGEVPVHQNHQRKSVQRHQDEAIKNWIENFTKSSGELPSNKAISDKAKSLVISSESKFHASKGWLTKFKKRNAEFFEGIAKTAESNKKWKKN